MCQAVECEVTRRVTRHGQESRGGARKGEDPGESRGLARVTRSSRIGARYRIRTCGPQLRRLMLYPSELIARTLAYLLHARRKGKEHPDGWARHGQGSPRCAGGAVRSQATVASRRRRSPRTVFAPGGSREQGSAQTVAPLGEELVHGHACTCRPGRRAVPSRCGWRRRRGRGLPPGGPRPGRRRGRTGRRAGRPRASAPPPARRRRAWPRRPGRSAGRRRARTPAAPRRSRARSPPPWPPAPPARPWPPASRPGRAPGRAGDRAAPPRAAAAPPRPPPGEAPRPRAPSRPRPGAPPPLSSPGGSGGGSAPARPRRG